MPIARREILTSPSQEDNRYLCHSFIDSVTIDELEEELSAEGQLKYEAPSAPRENKILT